MRGLKVILVEQGDWASGTSSASSKLIHGGLRYLETMDFTVVKKSLQERQLLISCAFRSATNWGLVNQHSRIGSWRLKVGLSIYDFLAGIFHSWQIHQRFNARQFLQRFPNLDKTSRWLYYRTPQTDDPPFGWRLLRAPFQRGFALITVRRVKYWNTME
ncbi:MAG: FAD-dependent oxidoreductase [Candidatus Methanofishera endochildressiae]|uniref:FAD-dependent oxidoreductase n=1 Tax=Candidatus Methanofishera endochildressiae TaxID=2738884 RepID=A0A7Z0SEL1_9GAMM|nr:FAD-dependent oxidoreductase [Candidatus Methanofishera endochildressiae]